MPSDANNPVRRIITFVNHTSFQLFVTSFAILYLELSLIRFIPAYVRYLGYFTNFILLGSFLGIGVGCLLAKKKLNLFPFFAPLFLVLVILVKFFKFEVQISTAQVVYFKSNSENNLVESFILLPSVFLVVSLLFTTLSQKLGWLLSKMPPLKAYTIDILGSIAGILSFTIGSFFSLPPPFWIGFFSLLYLFLHPRQLSGFIISFVFLVASQILLLQLDDLPTVWSPYYKISPYSVSNPQGFPGKPYNHWRLYVNNISHQEMTPYLETREFYKMHYEVFPANSFDQALIVGAGSGQDTNVALFNEVGTIDAVEIDPKIADFGRELHPDKPYSDSRVNLVINDARSFLENTSKKYDLIIFALPDSAILATSLSNLRLESYLFTIESFNQVKNHLSENGLFVMYNFYRTSWLVDKIAVMLEGTFSQKPMVARYQDNLAIFMAGPGLRSLKDPKPFELWQSDAKLSPATDNWPFLYLKEMTIPRIYLKSLGVIFLIAVALTFLVTKGRFIKNFAGDFFFLGGAFLLIETKSIVNFNLLFGSTWLVNSLVFIGILLSVLVAIWINSRWNVKSLWPWVAFLVLSLFINYFVPLERFLLPNFWIRYGVSIIFFFSPILAGNVIFSNLFKRAGSASDNFGANLLGAFFGGMFEYTSLLWGYHNLVLVALIFYCLAFFFIVKRLGRMRRLV